MSDTPTIEEKLTAALAPINLAGIEFPAGADIADRVIIVLGETDNRSAAYRSLLVATREQALHVLQDLGATLDTGPGDVDAVDQALGLLLSTSASLAALTAERDALKAQLDDLTEKYNVVALDQGDKARAIGPVKIKAGREAELAAAIDDAIGGTVELVFSNGKKEIIGIKPRSVTGSAAWVRHPAGLMLKERLLLGGPAAGQAAYDVVGIGMLVDGVQVGWCALHDPIAIAAGSTAELRDSIIF